MEPMGVSPRFCRRNRVQLYSIDPKLQWEQSVGLSRQECPSLVGYRFWGVSSRLMRSLNGNALPKGGGSIFIWSHSGPLPHLKMTPDTF